MYNAHFGFSEPPFSIAPDPRYLYMSERHKEALAHLLYGLESDGGFVLLTGEVGTGKTTVCRCLLEQVPAHCDVAFIFNPRLNVPELLSTVCDELGIVYPVRTDSIKIFTDLINAHLLEAHARGRKTVLIIDEAQNLSSDVLEQMRLLTNLETNQRKLLQIILLGQPELRDMLDKQELRQLAQRIIARYHLDALSREETSAYVAHRLAVAGVRGEIFPQPILKRLHALSNGIPRVINVLCDRALLGAYAQGKARVEKKTLANAAKEVLSSKPPEKPLVKSWVKWLAGALLLAAAGAAAYAYHAQEEAARQARLAKQRLAAAKAVPPPPTLAWPASQSREQSEVLSYQTVLGLWGAAWLPASGEPPCAQAEAQGLRCLTDKGGLDTLRRLNRPSVLKLYEANGTSHFAALVELNEKRATLLLGAERRSVPLDVLAMAWRGEFSLLWRLPPGYQGSLQPGSREPAVAWVDKLLAQYFRRAPQQGKVVYDQSLLEEIKRFQLAAGLQPDGVVGPVTLICLENDAADGVPLLKPKS